MKGICPKCGWETRELTDYEEDMAKAGRLRCSGKCQEGAMPNAPETFPPRLKLKLEEAK
jgi:hypothetical protein